MSSTSDSSSTSPARSPEGTPWNPVAAPGHPHGTSAGHPFGTSPGHPHGSAPRGAERAFNVLAALSVASWAFLGVRRDGALSPVRLALGAVHLTAAGLFWARNREAARGTPSQWLRAMPAFVAAGATFKHAPPPPAWGVGPTAIFFAGAALTVASLGALGRSFSVLPSRRDLVTTGPYSWVRHPAYLGEGGILIACAAAAGDRTGLALAAASIALLALRIQAEEELLSADAAHALYRKRVPWRLIPGVW